MIDLKKPLEGAPGLLLMAFLLLLGAAIGIGVTVLLVWIPMSDAFANFLGGVVGAGLGAVLAIGGAVYVQRQDNRSRLDAPINRLVTEVNDLLIQLTALRFAADAPEGVSFEASGGRKKVVANLISHVRATLSAFPAGEELPRSVHSQIAGIRMHLHGLLELAASAAERFAENTPYVLVSQGLDGVMKDLVRIREQLARI